jgi:hypothetical protein
VTKQAPTVAGRLDVVLDTKSSSTGSCFGIQSERRSKKPDDQMFIDLAIATTCTCS